MARLRINLEGVRFGRLLCVERIRDKAKKTTYYRCKCDCGKETKTQHAALKNGTASSCGCLQIERLMERSIKEPSIVVKATVYNYYKHNAKLRGVEFALSKEKFADLILSPCFYCTRKGATNTVTKRGITVKYNGVDRFNNNLGYTESNSVPCCKNCNYAKSDMSFEEFKNWIELVSSKLKEIKL